MRGRLLKTVLTFSLLFAGSLALSACGQKGPLYLPAEQPTTAKADAAAEKKEEKPATEGSTTK